MSMVWDSASLSITSHLLEETLIFSLLFAPQLWGPTTHDKLVSFMGFVWSIYVDICNFLKNVFSFQICTLKLVSAIFYQIFNFNQKIALQKLWKMFFISSKKFFLFSRYSNFSISVFPCFYPCQPLLKVRLSPSKKICVICFNWKPFKSDE